MTGYFFPVSIFFLSVGLLLYSLFDRQAMRYLLAHLSFYVLLTLVLVWVNQIRIFFEKEGRPPFKKYALGITIAFVLTGVIFLSVKPDFRILSDETNLLSCSRSMLVDRTIYNVNMGENYHGRLFAIDSIIPKRPFLFPFLTYIIHVLIGFSPANPFILNFLVMFFFLGMVYIFFRRKTENSSALAAMFLIASYPVFSIFGTSAGFDFLEMFFMFLSFFVLFFFLEKPAAESFALLWTTLILLAHVRYESFLYLIIVLGCLTFFRYLKRSYFREYPFVYSLTVFFSLPLIWQRIASVGGYQIPESQSLFSLKAFWQDFVIFMTRVPNQDFSLPYNGLINVIALAIIFYFFMQVIRKEISFDKSLWCFILVVFSCIVFHVVIAFALNADGIPAYTDPTVTRFMLILCALFAMMPVVLKMDNPEILSGRKLLVVSIALFLLFHPIAVKGTHTGSLIGFRLNREELDFLRTVRDKNILIISHRPGRFTALNYGAVSPKYASEYREDILNEYRKHYYTKIYLFQRIRYTDQKPEEEDVLHPEYRCHVLKEVRVYSDFFLRISEVLPPLEEEDGAGN